MFEIRIHGRGGQGVVTAAELLSVAAFLEGKHAQAFPSFGSERMGAPVVSYCRIDGKEIRLREPVMEPDAVIVQDPSLLAVVDVFEGLKPDGYILVNSRKSFAELGIAETAARFAGRIHDVGATELALKHIGRPLPNAVLLGAFAAATGAVQLASVCAAIREKFRGAIAEKNVAAASEAHASVAAKRGAGTDAAAA